MPAPRCYDCPTEDVAVKVIDTCGFEHWFCAEDWAAEQEFNEKVMAMLGDAARALEQD
jgi:prophage antirepressor-like protein